MITGRDKLRYLETGISCACLIGGVLLQWLDFALFATWAWRLGAGLVLAVAVVETGAAIWRREAGLDLLAIVAIGGAVALNETFAAAVIALMFSSGRALEVYAEGRARKEMSALLVRTPRFANRYDGAAIAQVPMEEVVPGDRLLVKAGETLPVDGTLVSPIAAINAASLTGESMPVSRAAGSALQSGMVNAGDAFDMLATRHAKDSTFSNIVRLVESAQRSKAPASRMADRFALFFIPLAVLIAGLAWIYSGDPRRALAVIVVATPCPLILAVPVAIVCAMSRCARHGVLVKHGGALEKLASATTLFLDKTGTLTSGNARLVAIETTGGEERSEMLRLAASLEQMSGHVIAVAVVRAACERGLRLSVPRDVQESGGAGLAGVVDGRTVRVGSLAFACATAAPSAWGNAFARRLTYEGATGVFVSIDGTLCGAMELADEIRLDTPRALRQLRAAGIANIVMLTGDRQEIAEPIAGSLGIDAVLADRTPESKLAAIHAARDSGTTIMVGDGINDTPALAAADIGVAMGARGTAAAAESAQVVLLVDRLDRLALAVRIARQTRRIALQSVFAGMGLSILAMIAAAFGYLPPVAGAILQEAIDIAVIFNALRVLRLGMAGTRLSGDETARLRQEHAGLMPVIDRLSGLADQAGSLPPAAVRDELAVLNDLLRKHILPHEMYDDATLYPALSRMLGGEDPMGAMSSTHREIHRLSRAVERLARHDTLDDAALAELRRTLYALDAILRLHFAQEEEIYHGLAS
jgi:heavy metal translocating P-type ATPase